MKQAAPKQKKSLADVCQERLTYLQSARRQKEDLKKRELARQQEDEVMAMTYGPNWRTRHLPGDPPPKLVEVKNEDDQDQDDDYEDEFPDAEDSHVRLKAS